MNNTNNNQLLNDNFEDIKNEIENASKYKIITLKDLKSDTSIAQINWLVEGLIPLGRAVLFSGREFTYKSFIIQNLCHSIANGLLFLNKFPCLQGKVLIADKENSKEEIRQHFEGFGPTFDENIHFIDKTSAINLYFDVPDAEIFPLLEVIISSGYKMFVIDSYIRFSRNNDENNASDIKRVSERISRLTQAGITVVIIDHHNKQGDKINVVRGSTEKRAFVDLHFTTSVEEDKQNIIRIENTKFRGNIPLKPFDIKFTHDPIFEFQYNELEASDITDKKERSKHLILDFLKNNGTSSRLSILNYVLENDGYAEAQLDKLLSELIQNNIILSKLETTSSGKTKLYSLPVPF